MAENSALDHGDRARRPRPRAAQTINKASASMARVTNECQPVDGPPDSGQREPARPTARGQVTSTGRTPARRRRHGGPAGCGLAGQGWPRRSRPSRTSGVPSSRCRRCGDARMPPGVWRPAGRRTRTTLPPSTGTTWSRCASTTPRPAPTTTSATAPRPCSPPWKSPPAGSPPMPATRATAAASSWPSSSRSPRLDPTGTGRTRWTMRWKPALNAFAITFGDRFPAAETY